MRDEVSHPGETAGENMVSYVLIFKL